MLPRSGFVLFTFIVCPFDARPHHTTPSQAKPRQRNAQCLFWSSCSMNAFPVSHDCTQSTGTTRKLSSSIACYLIVITKIERPLPPLSWPPEEFGMKGKNEAIIMSREAQYPVRALTMRTLSISNCRNRR